MLKQNQQFNSASLNAQPDHELPRYDVFELENGNPATQTSLLLKLTDECTAAIKNAVKSKCKIQMLFVNGIATIEFCDKDGNLVKFKCSLQNQPATDAISYGAKQKIYSSIGSTTCVKMQVQATDKTFAEMKEKTQRLVEAEQQKKAKDMPKTQRSVKAAAHQYPQVHKKGGSAITSSVLTKIASSTASKRTHSSSPISMPLYTKKTKIEIPSIAASKSPLMEFHKKKLEDDEAKKSVKTPPILQYGKEESTVTTKKDLFYVPKRKPIHRAPSISPASTATSTPKTISPPLALARPQSVESTQLQHSSSCSPEDIAGSQEEHIESMAMSLRPSRDWVTEFGKIEDKNDAKRYQECFKIDYPEYRQCYALMERVAGEFRKLQLELKKAMSETDRFQIEEEIRRKFATYQCDHEFLLKRQRHHDLRAKLKVIKHALCEWSIQHQ